NGARLANGSLVLAKIGRSAVRWSRPIEGTIKTVTVSEEADGWYVCCSCAEVPTQPLPRTGRETGSDVGGRCFSSPPRARWLAPPRHSRTAQKRLKKSHRRGARRKQGSTRRKKAVHLLATGQHQKVQRQRRDFHPTTALALVRRYGVRSLEDLPIRTLS